VVADEGFEYFAGSAAGATVFAESSRTLFNILDVSGDTGVLTTVFAGEGVGLCGATAGGAGSLETTFGGVGELAIGLDIVFSTTGDFADVERAGFTTFGAAFVDFALVVVFFVPSRISISTGSEMTFLGLPLFFTTSEDMLVRELGWEGTSLREMSRRGNREEGDSGKSAGASANLTRLSEET